MKKGEMIQEADLFKLLPPALTKDEKTMAFAKALTLGLQENARLANEAGIYYRIDKLKEEVLDILAADLAVDWYDKNADIEEKRRTIESAVFVHKKMGTPAAVQRLLEDNFGGGEIQEWFSYGGQHHKFQITVDSVKLMYENLDKFMLMLEKAKRASAVLEKIRIRQESEAVIGMGIASKTRFNHTVTSGTYDVSTVVCWADENGNILKDERGRILYV